MNKTLVCLLLSLAALNTAHAAYTTTAAPNDVELLPSGVRIEHLQRGDGPLPSASSTVLVHYHGTLSDGTVFDSSIERKQPISFPLRNVIPCWTQGVQHIKVGGKAMLTCPPAIAYGERGAGGVIPPNTTLNFEVELVSVRR